MLLLMVSEMMSANPETYEDLLSSCDPHIVRLPTGKTSLTCFKLVVWSTFSIAGRKHERKCGDDVFEKARERMKGEL
jgi:hypothetical protein